MALKGGAKLDATLVAILGKMKSADVVKVGFLADATYPDGTSVAMVASVQEFGSPKRGIPPRPFFRSMIAQSAPGWGKQMGAILKATDYDAAKTLGQMGEGIKGQLQQSIVDTNTPPNAPATLAQKAGAKPLVDTGHMLASVGYEVDAP